MFVVVAAGVALGLAGAVAAGRLVRSLLFGLDRADLLTCASASALLIASGLVHWKEVVVVMIASVAGTYVGVLAARRAPLQVIRAFVVTVGAVLTLVFFLR